MDVLAILVEDLAHGELAPLLRAVPKCPSQQRAWGKAIGKAKEASACRNRSHYHSFHFQLACVVFAQASACTENMCGITRLVKPDSTAA